MANNSTNSHNSDEENNIEQSPKILTIGKTVAKGSAKAGLKATKTVVKTSSKLAWRATKFTAEKTSKKIKNSLRRTIMSFVLANLAWIIPTAIILCIVFLSLGSLASTLMIVYAKEKIASAQENATDMLDTYADYLTQINEQKTIEYENDESIIDGSGGAPSSSGNSNTFNGTRGTAQALEGRALLTQVYNAMVGSVNQYNETGYDMEFIYGVAVTESCCSPIKWAFYTPVGSDYNANGDYDIKQYGLDEFMKARSNGTIDESVFHSMYNDGNSFLGPWQMTHTWFKPEIEKPSNWSTSTWLSTFNGARYDPMNMVESMDLLGHSIVNTRKPTLTKTKLKTSEDQDDMMRMIYATRHQGISNSTKTRADGCSFSNYETNTEWVRHWCYPYIEGLNPHIDLMRSAIQEYETNGPLFQEYKAFMESQTQTNSNGNKSTAIIDKLYEKNGWEKVSGGWRKKFGDGDGFMTVKGQFVGYPFRVYWGAKVGFPEFQKLAQNG